MNSTNSKHRILLLLPTRTYRAGAFLKAARQLGIEVVVGSNQAQTLSRYLPAKSLTLNFHKPEQATQKIVEFARKYPFDAVVGVDDDSVLLAAMASAALSLPHNSIESVIATRNKYRMREILARAGVPSPDFWLFSLEDPPADLAQKVTFPCVVKPVSLSASQGVIRADDEKQFVQAFYRLASILENPEVRDRLGTAARQVLVEGFISGPEFALEGLLIRGKLKVLALFDKPDPLEGPFFEETLYITPSRFPTSVQEAIATCTAQAAEALGLKEGPVHAELRYNHRGPWIIEIAARSIGGLCSRTLRFGTGLSLEELILRHAIGLEVESFDRERPAAGVMMLPIPHAGILRAVHGKESAAQVEGIEEIVISIPLEQEVQPLPEGSKYLGFIFAHGESPAFVEEALREAYRRLEIVIIPQKY